MGELAKAFGPAFAAGFAVQRTLEILDGLFGMSPKFTPYKKMTYGLISLALGLALAIGCHLCVIAVLMANTQATSLPSIPAWADVLITALVVSGGTEGFNSIMKFLTYTKEQKKADAATKTAAAMAQADGKAAMAALSSK